ncbi:hypothetical protein K440DRAFT_304275 [Wilcoxina mikolae CBS 423.85]|nr:hypothetical protein K440DRAFT_304275 [Wilcoxina mikolae CBS 423.85]
MQMRKFMTRRKSVRVIRKSKGTSENHRLYSSSSTTEARMEKPPSANDTAAQLMNATKTLIMAMSRRKPVRVFRKGPSGNNRLYPSIGYRYDRFYTVTGREVVGGRGGQRDFTVSSWLTMMGRLLLRLSGIGKRCDAGDQGLIDVHEVDGLSRFEPFGMMSMVAVRVGSSRRTQVRINGCIHQSDTDATRRIVHRYGQRSCKEKRRSERFLPFQLGSHCWAGCS